MLALRSVPQVGDDDRGYLLELLLTKLRYATAAKHGKMLDQVDWEHVGATYIHDGLQV